MISTASLPARGHVHVLISDFLAADNPFAKRESHGGTSITTYKVFTFLTWLLSIVATCWYTFHAPRDGHHARKTIWQQNSSYDTAFSLNSTITSIYWCVSPPLLGAA